jgi:cytochrome c-550 PedF
MFDSKAHQSKPFFNRVAAIVLLAASGFVHAHGNVTPQAVDTGDLPKLSGWVTNNPYSGNEKAAKIGDSAYNQNCARCHGLEAVSGGIAPDLRRLDNECVNMKDAKKQSACLADVNEYFIGRFRHGVTRNGAVYMPPFEGVLSQEAAWTIKTYLETRREKPLVSAK